MKQTKKNQKNVRWLPLSLNLRFAKKIFFKFYLIPLSGVILLFSCKKLIENTDDASQADISSKIKISTSAATGDEFTIAVIGDTQNYVDFENLVEDNDCQAYQPLVDELQWIADNKTTENIKYVISVGDITDNYNPPTPTTESTNQWIRARNAYNILIGIYA